ncbi:MAG: zinc ribbon domain-containing protein [Promethearchaeota archaeon]|nr:MAG: zinc ribbon domain-containing protein [Candidatus Lokiarchaeota archaeon]
MKKYWWFFPFIGGILTTIGVLTPIASFDTYFSIWMWGLVISRSIGYHIEFIDDETIFITGISAALLIVVCSFVLIITGFLYKRAYFDNRKIGKLWIGCGILILSGTIVSLVSLDFYTYYGFFPYGIWDYLNPGFGAIGPIMGSIIAIGIGAYIAFSETGKRDRQRKVIPISKIAPKSTCPFCGKPISLNASFCSKCGNKIET